MGPQGPFEFSWEYLWVLAVACFFGTANFIRKLKAGKVSPWNFVEFVGELVISAAAGLLMYWVCRAYQVDPWISAACIAIAGHMGTRLILSGEKFIERKFQPGGNGDAAP